MKRTLSVTFMAIALAVARGWAADSPATNLDNTILGLALTDFFSGGGYMVIRPKADLDSVDIGLAEYIKDSLSFGAGSGTNAVIASLVDQLFERNKLSGTRKAIQLSLVSSLTNGYVVDHEGNYGKYFQNDGGSWPLLYQENPKVRGIVTTALPAYDEKTGLVLVYRGTHKHGLEGWGEVTLYHYERGKLTKLKSTALWKA